MWLARYHGWRLRRVDERCGQLAGLVDAQSRGEESLLVRGEGLLRFWWWLVIVMVIVVRRRRRRSVVVG